MLFGGRGLTLSPLVAEQHRAASDDCYAAEASVSLPPGGSGRRFDCDRVRHSLTSLSATPASGVCPRSLACWTWAPRWVIVCARPLSCTYALQIDRHLRHADVLSK
jgi:hypothetical protein